MHVRHNQRPLSVIVDQEASGGLNCGFLGPGRAGESSSFEPIADVFGDLAFDTGAVRCDENPVGQNPRNLPKPTVLEGEEDGDQSTRTHRAALRHDLLGERLHAIDVDTPDRNRIDDSQRVAREFEHTPVLDQLCLADALFESEL